MPNLSKEAAVKIGIALAVIFALGWYTNSMTREPIDCTNEYELGFRLFWGQGHAIVCRCIPPEKRHDVTC